MDKELLEIVREKGLLLEKGLFDVLEGFNDVSIAKSFLEGLERVSGQKMITSASLTKHIEGVKQVVSSLPGEAKNSAEKIFVKMGVHLEITKEKIVNNAGNLKEKNDCNHEKKREDYAIFYGKTKQDKKIDVSDFVGHFRSRYQQLQRILMQRQGLKNLTSINKISGNRQTLTIIGMLTEKRITKNKNLILTFEDLTGKINCLFKEDNEFFKEANELQLDDVVAVRASGNNEFLFGFEIFFPDSFLPDKVKFDEDICVAFISDIHCGSKKHLGKEFEKFLEWINNGNNLAKKIKYLFVVGDNVDGVGVFPGQKSLLELTSLKEQYELLASYLKKIPKEITMFMCPGQHDSVWVGEPQPVIENHYGASLYDIDNLILVPNPTLVKLKEGEKNFKVFMYHGASIHSFINNISELRLMKAHQCPAKAVRHMLKRRHVAPMHSLVDYIPNSEHDPMVISEVPDVFCTGEVHRLDIESYNGVIIITGSCWQAQTDFEEKVGNIPDPCKVPVLNLKTRELKILDFGENDGD